VCLETSFCNSLLVSCQQVPSYKPVKMPRKVFLADLEKLSNACPIAQVSGVRRGEDDMFHFRVEVPVAPDIYERVEIAATVVPGQYNSNLIRPS
jgi:hypothetical protein